MDERAPRLFSAISHKLSPITIPIRDDRQSQLKSWTGTYIRLDGPNTATDKWICTIVTVVVVVVEWWNERGEEVCVVDDASHCNDLIANTVTNNTIDARQFLYTFSENADPVHRLSQMTKPITIISGDASAAKTPSAGELIADSGLDYSVDGVAITGGRCCALNEDLFLFPLTNRVQPSLNLGRRPNISGDAQKRFGSAFRISRKWSAVHFLTLHSCSLFRFKTRVKSKESYEHSNFEPETSVAHQGP